LKNRDEEVHVKRSRFATLAKPLELMAETLP